MIIQSFVRMILTLWIWGTFAISLALYISNVKDDMFSNLQNVAEFFQRIIEIKNMIDIH